MGNWTDIDKKLGIKCLFELFYENSFREIARDAIVIDKMQTFYMAYHPNLKTGSHDPSKTQKRNFKKFLKADVANKGTQGNPAQDYWFSSDTARNYFEKICAINGFDINDPRDRLLAFELADGLLEESKIKEIAVLETLYFDSKNVAMIGHDEKSRTAAKNIQEAFSKLSRDDYIEIIEKYPKNSKQVERIFERLRSVDGVVEYFNYQKSNGYPLISQHLYDTWVDRAIKLIDIIKNNIILIKEQDNHSEIKKYFPTILSSNSLPVIEQSLQFLTDGKFNKKIAYTNNKLLFLILDLFSDLDIELFGVCENEYCGRSQKHGPKIFIKFPKPNKRFCSNKCAAYHATYTQRKDDLIMRLKGDCKLMMFTRSGCEDSVRQEKINNEFERLFNWKIQSIDIENNPNVVRKYKIKEVETPSIRIVCPKSNQTKQFSKGVVSIDELRTKLSSVLKKMKKKERGKAV